MSFLPDLTKSGARAAFVSGFGWLIAFALPCALDLCG